MGEPHGHSSPFASLAHRLAFILSVSEVPYPLLHLLLTFCFLLAAFLVPFVGGFAWLLIGALYWALILSGSKRSRLSGELAIRIHVLVWSVLGLTCLLAVALGSKGQIIPGIVFLWSLLVIGTNLSEVKRQKLITDALKLAREGRGGEAAQTIAPLLPDWDRSQEGKTELQALIALVPKAESPEFWVALNRRLASLERETRRADEEYRVTREEEARRHGYGCHCCEGDLDHTKCPVCGLTACWNCGEGQRWLAPRFLPTGPQVVEGQPPLHEQWGWQDEPIRVHRECLAHFKAIDTERRMKAARGELGEGE